MKRLICLGDSITDSDRLFSPNGLGYGYVNELHSLLHQTGADCEMINRGVNGFTVGRILANAGQDCLDRCPDIVTILIGINDVGIIMNTDRTPSQQLELLAKFGVYYRKLLEKIRQHSDCKIILMEPFTFPHPMEYMNWIPWAEKISEQIGELAMEFQLPYLLLHNRLNQAALAEGYHNITTDGVHLTSRGHHIIAEELFQLLCKLQYI